MDLTQTLALLTILLQITFLEGVLSLDNAAVLGALVLSLPADKPVPWPRALQPLAHLLNPLLGKQRSAGLRVGLLGAYLGRALMLVMASFVIRNPWLQLLGAAYLIKIAVGELGAPEKCADGEPDPDDCKPARERGFWGIVLTVELMDLAFSLDNVVVVISLSSQLWLVMLGVAIGIVTMRFAAGFFTHLIERIPPLATAAYVLVFNIGVELILSHLLNLDIPDFTRFAINVGTLLMAVVYARVPAVQQALRTPFKFIRLIFSGLDLAFKYAFLPFEWIIGKLVTLVSPLFQRSSLSTKSGD